MPSQSVIMFLKHSPVLSGTANLLPASKSIANRALIINALAGNKATIENLSDANDTQLMLNRISSDEKIIDVEDAGTTMRFLTAYFTATNKPKTLTGTARMKERPIGILVDALRSLGAEIDYVENEGFPPIAIRQFNDQRTRTLSIRGDVSSQYISALMMIAPTLPKGLELTLTGRIGSRPYIEMTGAIMKHFGASVSFEGDKIDIPSQSYKGAQFFVESDWSAASYWFALVALAREARISLPKLSIPSIQGDSAIQKIMTSLGVTAELKEGMLHLRKSDVVSELKFDFTDCPDLAQTVAVVCAAKGVNGFFTGLESLRIKETDRIAALQTELRKLGADLIEDDPAHWRVIPSVKLPDAATISTYKDHRMAMAFAPLATLMNVTIENPAVVRKSYPNYWNDLRSCGVAVEES